MNLILSISCLFVWAASSQIAPPSENDSRITQIEIFPESSQDDLEQMVKALAEDNIQLKFSKTKFSGGKLDQVEGVIQFDPDNYGSFLAEGLERIKITWEWKGDILANLQIQVEGAHTNKHVNTQH